MFYNEDNYKGGNILKKYTKIAYIILIISVLLFGFFIYKVSGKNSSSEDVRSKSISEIKHLESKFLNLFNKLNNVSFENYTISSSQIKKEESEEQTSKSSSETSGGNEGESKQQDSEGSQGSQGSQSSNSESSTSSKEDNKKYKLEETGILTSNSEVNWNQIKNDVENIYTSLYPTTIDLYQTSTNQEDIINFNKEYDNLTKAVKDENKDDTLMELSLLYNYLPKFIENCTDEEKEKIVIKTKNEIFKAYSILDKEEWATISESINNAAQEFTKLVTSVSNQEKGNQYNINKAYIMINELQNAILIRDKEVFLIKYKNLLEELQNI